MILSTIVLPKIDMAIVITYIIGIMILGIWSGYRKKTSSTQFFLAGRSLPWTIIGPGLFCANISTIHLVGLAAYLRQMHDQRSSGDRAYESDIFLLTAGQKITIFEYMNMSSEHESLAALFHALAHPIRYCIVEGLVRAGRDVSTMVHCLEEPQPKISQHLNVLKAAGVIEGHRDGVRIVYSIADERVRKIVEAVGSTHLWDNAAKV